MNDVVADTNAIIWHLSDPSQLTSPAAATLNAAEVSGRIFVATITLVEMTYLVEKFRLDPLVLSELWSAIRDPLTPIEILALSIDVADTIRHIPRTLVPDMPDRIITATALAHSLPLVTSDGKIRAVTLPGLSVIW